MHLKVDIIPGVEKSRHVVFLHGLFGKGQSFQFIAKARAMQQNFTCHMVDLRNHGASGRHSKMDYESLANDLNAYIKDAGLAK